MIAYLKRQNRRILCAIGAAAVALSLIIGGVFAWADNSQHKSNIITGGNHTVRDDVVLVEDFDQPADWQLDEELKKEISVKNTGDGQIYVRLQLKEYMDIAQTRYTYSEEPLLTDSSGRFVAGATADDLKIWLDNRNVVYSDSQIKAYTAYGETGVQYYLATDASTNINGIYGKRLMLDYVQSAPSSLVDGITRAAYEDTDNHRLHPTAECRYTPHLWNGSSADPFHEYVEWTMGAPLIKLSDWDGRPTAAWILDDTSDEGWVYWGEALKPGESTAKLLQSIKLIQQPSGPFYYALHVDLQAVDMYQLKAEFTGIPQKVEDSYRGKTGLAITPDVQVVGRGGRVDFSAGWNGATVSPDDVVWTVTVGTVPEMGANTGFDTPGVLTIDPLQPAGTIIVTATYSDDGDINTQKYVITVK